MSPYTTITIDGTDHFRSWLDSRLDEMPSYMFGTVAIVTGPALTVRCSGLSRCAEDDADYDHADRLRDVVRDVASEYPGDDGANRWGEREDATPSAA